MKEIARLKIGLRAAIGGISPDGRLIALKQHRRPGFQGNNTGWDTVRVFPVAPILASETPAALYEIAGSARQFDCMEFSPDPITLLPESKKNS